MLKNRFFTTLVLLLLSTLTFAQNLSLIEQINTTKDSVGIIQIKTNTIFKSNQAISLLVLPKNTLENFSLAFAQSGADLKKTSTFAEENNALAAINGGFFNVKDGGSVTYLEIDDAVIAKTNRDEGEWNKSDSMMNGAVVLTKDARMLLQPVNSEIFYEKSKAESGVLVTGPFLLQNSETVQMQNTTFVNFRHPRSCLCVTEKALVFVAIDGRSKDAYGMTLPEVQQFLLGIGCVDAINLDGGGSTTLWTKGRGIINSPSDKTGERNVSNALLILRKSTN